MLVVTIVVGIILLLRKGSLIIIGLPSKNWLLPVLAGIFSALDHALWSTAIENTNVANATLLNYIAPLWVGLVAIYIFHEKLSQIFWVGLILVLVGIFVISKVRIDDFSSAAIDGEGFALFSSFFYAGYFIFTQRGRQHFKALEYLWATSVVSMIILLIIIIVSGLSIIGYSLQTYIIIIAAGLVSQLGGYYCLIYALGKITASVVSPVLTLQPVLTAIFATVLIGEALDIYQIGGGGLVLTGIYLITLAKIPEHNPTADPGQKLVNQKYKKK